MPSCAVFCCTNCNKKTKGTGIKYFSFPKDSNLCERWINACRRKDKINVKNARVCSVHFSEGSFDVPLRQKLLNYTPQNSRNLKPDAVPTEKLPGISGMINTDRSIRLTVRNRHKLVDELIPRSCEHETDSVPEESTSSGTVCSESNPVDLNETIKQLQDEIKTWKIKYFELFQEKERLEEQIKKLKKTSEKDEKNVFSASVTKIFTPGQIKALSNPGRKVLWSNEDIAAAISLRSISPKGYRFLRNNNFPLPAFSTLRDWASCLHLNPGILQDVLYLMKHKGTELSVLEKLTVLSFDEMYISNKICIDRGMQQKVGPHKTCQTIMCRGLIGKWKQPVYYAFDTSVSKLIMMQVISELNKIGFVVVAITSDMGSGNMKLWSELNIDYEKKSSFPHPDDPSKQVYVFADIPHLLKLLRNHLLDQGFWVNEKHINRSCFEKLISNSTSDVKIAFKISKYHLDVRGTERQKVKPAAQLFSNQVAKAIEYCGMKGFLDDCNWQETAKFTDLINKWFDLFNTDTKFGKHPGINGFGVNFESQSSLVQTVNSVIKDMRVGSHKGLIQFQKGILISNQSLERLFRDLKEKYKIEYLLTRRLNQDVLENFFSYIRGMGGANDHPSALDFTHRLKWYILGKHSASIFSQNRNTDDSIMDNSLVNPLDADTCLTQSASKCVRNIGNDNEIEETIQFTNIEEFFDDQEIDGDVECGQNISMPNPVTLEQTMSQEGLMYLAGYIAYRFRDKFSYLGSDTCELHVKEGVPDWLQFISLGKLKYPCEALVLLARNMEDVFNTLHENSLSSDVYIFNQLAEKTLAVSNSHIPLEVAIALARTRIYIRVRELNKKLSEYNSRRKLRAKIQKFSNVK